MKTQQLATQKYSRLAYRLNQSAFCPRLAYIWKTALGLMPNCGFDDFAGGKSNRRLAHHNAAVCLRD